MVVAVLSHNLVYAPVPKAGCTSVKVMLAELDADAHPPEDAPANRNFHKLYPTRRFRKFRFDQYRDAFRFTVVRDPIKRLMSVYTNRVIGLRDLHKSPQLRQQDDLPLDPDPDTFFQNLRRYIQLSSIVRHHVKPTSRFTGGRLTRYDKVYRTDQMGDLAADLTALTGQTISAKKANSSKTRLEFGDLKSETQDRLRPPLASEYRFLSTYFDNPLD